MKFVGKFFIACLAAVLTQMGIAQSNYNPPPAAATQFRQGSATPATCHAPQVFMVVSAGTGTPYYCSAANTWTAFGSGSGTVTGTGTLNFIPAWTSSTALGNSHIDDGIANPGSVTSSESFVVTGGLSVNNPTAGNNTSIFNNTGNSAFVNNTIAYCSGMTAGQECVSYLSGQALSSANNAVRFIFHFTGAGLTTNYAYLDFFNGARYQFGANSILQLGAIQSTATKFTTSGCSVSSTTGGASAGKFTLGANTCTVVITMNGATGMSATNGWSCWHNDETTGTGNALLFESGSNASTASLSIPSTAGTTDVIDFGCVAF